MNGSSGSTKRSREPDSESGKRNVVLCVRDEKMEVSEAGPKISASVDENGPPTIPWAVPCITCDMVEGSVFKTFSHKALLGHYYLVIFYPNDFSPLARSELLAFSDRMGEFTALGCKLFGCSTDSKYNHLAWFNTSRENGGLGQLKFPLLADKSTKFSASHGVLNERKKTTPLMLLIVDAKQNVRQMILSDETSCHNVDEILRLVSAIQYADNTGKICPGNWKPGDEGLSNHCPLQKATSASK
ncbi:peroxiredoxin-2-like isoform X1 [Penaeus chinensis]|uniref:peroxiredoxin-2-like isoform X1 n=1 Tax=Penaeus chinensis TaxID=139456 RepID=UPI001FB7BA9A|nr:peroxiredoxin-2-like isoform X1 [Penaeus chinensis]